MTPLIHCGFVLPIQLKIFGILFITCSVKLPDFTLVGPASIGVTLDYLLRMENDWSVPMWN